MPAFKLAESRNVKIGDPIHILGFPGVVLTHELLNSAAKVEASASWPWSATSTASAARDTASPVVRDRSTTRSAPSCAVTS